MVIKINFIEINLFLIRLFKIRKKKSKNLGANIHADLVAVSYLYN